MLPWIIKPLFGVISDAFPINGQARRPYVLGPAFCGVICLILMYWVDSIEALAAGCLMINVREYCSWYASADTCGAWQVFGSCGFLGCQALLIDHSQRNEWDVVSPVQHSRLADQ